METILLKLGGSLITDKTKPFTARHDVIKRLAKEVSEARAAKKFRLVIGHGGGSFPHQPAHDYKTAEGAVNEKSWIGFALTQNAASVLNRIIVNALLEQGLNAVSLQPSACCIASNKRIKKWFDEPLKQMLDADVIPVPYGDAALDEKQGCAIISTEEILCFLASKLKANRLIIATDVDGVLDEENKVIPLITRKNFAEIKNLLKGARGKDVTGGMLHKVERLLDARVESVIVNGLKKERVKNALLEKNVEGTKIRGGIKRLNHSKLPGILGKKCFTGNPGKNKGI